MKKVLFVSILMIMLLVSCSDKKPESEDFDVIEKSVSSISEDTFLEVTLTPGNSLKLSDYTEETGLMISLASSSKSFGQSATKGNSDVVITKNGFALPVPHENGTTTIPPGLLNPNNQASVRIEKFSFDDDLEINQTEMSDRNAINGRPKHINERGEMATEEFYRIDLKKGKYKGFDVSEVAILQIIHGDIIDYSNPEYGFIQNDKIGLTTSGNDIYGLVDLRGKKAITVFNTIEYKGGTNMAAKIVLAKPEELIVGQPLNITSNVNEYKITSEGKSGDYYIHMTTTSGDEDYFNMLYQIVVRTYARARYITGDHLGNRKPLTLIPITRSGDTIDLWVGEIDEPFIFDCCIRTEVEEGDFGTIELRSASGSPYADWFKNSEIDEEGTTYIDLSKNESGSVYIKGLEGEYTVTVKSTYYDEASKQYRQGAADFTVVYSGIMNQRDLGSMDVDFGATFTPYTYFDDGYMVISYWNPRKEDKTTAIDSRIEITLTKEIHTDIRFDINAGTFRCFDEDCERVFTYYEIGDMCRGKWAFTLGGKPAVVDITEWGPAPVTISDQGVIKNIVAVAGFDTTTYRIYLDFPGTQYEKMYLERLYAGQSMYVSDGSIMTRVE